MHTEPPSLKYRVFLAALLDPTSFNNTCTVRSVPSYSLSVLGCGICYAMRSHGTTHLVTESFLLFLSQCVFGLHPVRDYTIFKLDSPELKITAGHWPFSVHICQMANHILALMIMPLFP